MTNVCTDRDRAMIKEARRIVVKVGSNVITRGSGLNHKIIGGLADQMAGLLNDGREVIIVSSGAIAAGLRRMKPAAPPSGIPEKQALAAVGQGRLIQAWERPFAGHGFSVAQMLLTSEGLTDRRRYLNARNTLFTLLEWGVVPVINENDTVVVEEIMFGDNDNLAAMVLALAQADILVILTDIDGLMTADPRVDPGAELIEAIECLTPEIMEMAGAAPGAVGRGGMRSKLISAEKVALCRRPTIIADGRAEGVLTDVFAGQRRGTFVRPHSEEDSIPAKKRKQWIAFGTNPKGAISVDAGAARAMVENGKSLLPVGVTAVEGRFMVGEPVEVVGPGGERLGVGLVNYSARQIERIMGLHTHEIEAVLGGKFFDEVIHRDHLVIIDSPVL